MSASLAVTVLVCVTLGGAEAEEKKEKKPRDPAYLETIRGLEKRLAAKDIDGSLALFVAPDQPGGAERLRLRIERIAKEWDAKKTFQVADHRAKGSCAVAVVLEKPEDPDPMYLVRGQNGWRILPEITGYRKGVALGRGELADFEELEKWFEERKAALLPRGRKPGRAAKSPGVAPAASPEMIDAILQRRTKVVEKLLAEGANPDAVDKNGQPLLVRAVKSRSPEIVKLLLDRKAGVDAVSEATGRTALYQAAFDGRVEIARILLDRGADVNARNRFQATPLHDAAAGGKAEVVKLLLEKGGDPGARDRDGATPAALTPEGPDGDQVRKLLAEATRKRG